MIGTIDADHGGTPDEVPLLAKARFPRDGLQTIDNRPSQCPLEIFILGFSILLSLILHSYLPASEPWA